MKYVVRLDFNDGVVVPDLRVADFVNKYVETAGEIVIGSELILHEIRCRIKSEHILPTDIVIMDQWGTPHTLGRNAKLTAELYSSYQSIWEDQLYILL